MNNKKKLVINQAFRQMLDAPFGHIAPPPPNPNLNSDNKHLPQIYKVLTSVRLRFSLCNHLFPEEFRRVNPIELCFLIVSFWQRSN